MNHAFGVRVGPFGFRIGSAWRRPVDTLAKLYAAYPAAGDVADYTVRLEPAGRARRWLRPSVRITGDYALAEASPLSLAHGLLGAEMGMNLQVALGERRFLLLHAASVERDGRVLILTGASGAGKSTLAALLGERGWRFMGDEFALIDPATGLAHPFPRPVSLKNESVELFGRIADARWGPVLDNTPKGRIRHLVPRADAIVRMTEAAAPALIVFPQFGAARAVRAVPPSEAFVRLTQASTNYVALGERGFAALTGLIEGVPSVAIDYPDTKTALGLIEELAVEA